MNREPRPARRLTYALALVAALLLGSAGAHATLVIGELVVTPDPPVPGEPLEVSVKLVDPLLVPVEKALVRVELREIDPEDPAVPPSITGSEATAFLELPTVLGTDYLPEVEAGRYAGTFVAPEAGRYTLSVRDTTFRNEEAIANVGVDLGAGANGGIDFVLPPTPIGPSSLVTWLVWIVGIPLAVGLVVTFLVLRRGGDEEPDEAADEAPQAG